VKMPQQEAIIARRILPVLASILFLAMNLPTRPDFTIARGATTRCVIVQQPGATLAET
jgi:hypothetical protein